MVDPPLVPTPPVSAARPPIFGVAGGVGSGKSRVAEALGRRGAYVVDADRLAHDALDDPGVAAAVVREFGTGILGSGGRIERPRLAAAVFGPGPDAAAHRRKLESVVHPAVLRMIHERLADAVRRAPRPPFVVLDVPLLVEGETAALCDAIVFVDAPDDVRRARTASARRWTDEGHRSREAAQAPLEVKRSASRFVVVNDGDESALSSAVDRLFAELLAFRPARPGVGNG
jgi:dephospho-CoA kinase